ncbi:MAG: alcohol dehydrogenase catalytic domain-containing protein [Firmicutes bacterium]|nr:alcohol dehydrogenase catalytic domain-containing protein [Bacillota bacterium]
MKAVKLYEAGDLRVEEVDIPELEPGCVLVKVKAVGVCGSDIPRVNFYGAYHPNLTIGHEFSGEIVKVNQVGNWQVGDRVVVPPLIPCNHCQWCRTGHYSLCEDYSYFGSRRDGAMAEYVTVPEKNLLPLPDNVPFEAGAMVDPAANAIHGIWKGEINPGDTVAIYGCGPIGLFAIQFAKILGAGMVIAIDVKEQKLNIARDLGADEVINALGKPSSAAVSGVILPTLPPTGTTSTGILSLKSPKPISRMNSSDQPPSVSVKFHLHVAVHFEETNRPVRR